MLQLIISLVLARELEQLHRIDCLDVTVEYQSVERAVALDRVLLAQTEDLQKVSRAVQS